MKKRFIGKVTSVKQQNTVVVEITRKVQHPLYKKVLIKTKKIQADTAGQKIELGQEVTIEETRPISKTKYFKVVEVKK
ncbi:MAG TPA: 30S ribosomal protein S17 [Patescibacteria group bacterium]